VRISGILKAQLLSAGVGRGGRGREADARFARVGAHAVALHALLPQGKDHVQLVVPQQREQLLARAGPGLDRDVGKALVIVGQQRQQNVEKERFKDADAQRAVQIFRLAHGDELDLLGDRNKLIGVVAELLAARREGDAVAHAVEELVAQLRFQLLDLHRDRGLGIAEAVCRMSEIFHLRRLQKGDDIAQFHNFPPDHYVFRWQQFEQFILQIISCFVYFVQHRFYRCVHKIISGQIILWRSLP
jgi:hypothetical protein